jgi:two-component system sensor histidine kinase EvgS
MQIGMLELTLKRIEQDHPDRPAIDVAYNSAKDLLELIGDILDIARIESGHLSLSPERVNPQEIVASVARNFDGLAHQKGLELRLEFNPANPPIDVLLDPLRFKQVLSNLVSNAIKFTERGQVRIIVNLQPSAEPGQVRMQLQVEDSGIGISEQDQQRLFEPFAQADNAGQSARGGTGLGLVISRGLCERMGAACSYAVSRGWALKGITLHLPTLPREPGPKMVETETPAALTPLNVLVVDDHAANRLLMCQQLEFLAIDSASLRMVRQDRAMESRHLRSGHCRLQHAGHEWLRASPRHSPPGMPNATTPVHRAGIYGQCTAGRNSTLQTSRNGRLPVQTADPDGLSQWVEGMEPMVLAPVFSLQGFELMTGGNPVLNRRLLTELINSNRLDRQSLLALSGSTDPQVFSISPTRSKVPPESFKPPD